MPLGCSHAQSRVKLILSASTSKINISGHPTGASGIEFHYKGPDISYLLNTEEERKLTGAQLETRIKEPIFIRTLRLKFNMLNPLNKNLEADTGGGSYITGFMSSDFLRTFKNS